MYLWIGIYLFNFDWLLYWLLSRWLLSLLRQNLLSYSFYLFNRDVRLFEMLVFIIRIIRILSSIWLMFFYLKTFILIVNGWILISYKCLKSVEACAPKNLLCYYTENDVSTKVGGRRYD